MPHVYFLQPAELVGTDRYKIGMTAKSDLSRVKSYKVGTRYLCIMECQNALETEQKLISTFNTEFKLIAGNEYFQIENETHALSLFFQIVSNSHTITLPKKEIKEPTNTVEKSEQLFVANKKLVQVWFDNYATKVIKSNPCGEESDKFMNWFNSEYEKTTEKTDIIKISDVFKNYCQSDFYRNLNKKEKRANNKTKFIEKVSNNVSLKIFYKECHQPIIDGKRICMRNILTNYKVRQEDNS